MKMTDLTHLFTQGKLSIVMGKLMDETESLDPEDQHSPAPCWSGSASSMTT